MSSVGRRPSLDELILALCAINSVEADADTLDPNKETFRVVLTFQREQCPEDWVEGQPKPTWLFEELIEQLRLWRQQCMREAQWVAKEEQFGAGIDTLMAYWMEELKKNASIKPENMLTRALKQTLSNTILRLRELKERREAGGVYSATENRRDKARKAWMEDEYEAPKREEEQRRAREGDFSGGFDDLWQQAEDLLHRSRNKTWEEIFTGYSGQRQQDPLKPQAGNKRSWHVILGVSARASKKEIIKAYRKLASQYHPDRYKESDGHAKMAEINTARDEGLGGA